MSAYEDDGVIQWVGKYQRVELQGDRSSNSTEERLSGVTTVTEGIGAVSRAQALHCSSE